MMNTVGRRLAAKLVASLLAAAPQFPVYSAEPAAAPCRAVAVVAGGFLIPPDQYKSYADALERLGCSTIICADNGSLSKAGDLSQGAAAILELAERRAAEVGLSKDAPLVLLGHSRGGKVVAAAAATSKQRQLASLVLIDPVDATGPDPTSALGELRRLSRAPPTCILGSGAGSGDCSQNDYLKFEDAIGTLRAPLLVGALKRAGHTQFVDNRRVLTVDVCTTGRDKDADIRQVALAATTAWVGACLGVDGAPSSAESRQRAVASLVDMPFQASVEWRSADIY